MPQRILVVDDDKSIVRVLRGYLEQSGYQVLTAADGESALHMLRRERPDLVILDLMMPNLDGWEVTRIVRADKGLAATPIIMLTARVEDTDKIVGLELGADDYITKPFNAREVVARVERTLAADPARPTGERGAARVGHRRAAARSGSTHPDGGRPAGGVDPDGVQPAHGVHGESGLHTHPR